MFPFQVRVRGGLWPGQQQLSIVRFGATLESLVLERQGPIGQELQVWNRPTLNAGHPVNIMEREWLVDTCGKAQHCGSY